MLKYPAILKKKIIYYVKENQNLWNYPKSHYNTVNKCKIKT